MQTVAPMTEPFQHFVRDLKESLGGDLYGQARGTVEKFLNQESVRLREEAVDCEPRKPWPTRRGQRNGFYFRDFVSRFGTLRLKVARTREKSFLPGGLGRFQRRAAEVMLLIREAFLRGLSTRQVGRVVAILTDEGVSAQTVSRLSRSLDHLVKALHQARLRDEWAYLFLDGVSLRVRRPGGRKRVQILVAYGVRADGSRRLLAFLRSPGESQAAWEGLLQDLYRRGLTGGNLLRIVTDGCAGLAAAIQTVYPRVAHPRCWVHKMRNLCEAVRRRDHDPIKHQAQKIYQAASLAEAQRAFLRFKWNGQRAYPGLVRRREKDLPELRTFFRFPPHLWRKLRTTNAIERCFVEVRRRTRPMVCFVNVESVDRIIYAIFNGLNDQWRNRTLRIFTQAA